jgi:DtxR family transcriptional regulator, Mn-dependent transcriptional regulator
MSITEENYLKAIFKLSEKDAAPVNTNAVAAAMQTSAASVTDMLKKLSDKEYLEYEKYRGVQLTPKGRALATDLIRRHRLWEVFLTEKLGFTWDKVHDMAEELEHINNEELTDRLDHFLGFPRFDPHGDPIPDAEGKWFRQHQVLLSSLQMGQKGVITGVDDHSTAFLQYLNHLGLGLGIAITVVHRMEYDNSMIIQKDDQQITVSEKVVQHLFVKTSA